MKNKLYITRRPDKRTRTKLKEIVRHYELKKGSRINNSYKFYTGFANNLSKWEYGTGIDVSRGQGKI
jgi:hypothetical protein